MSDEESMELEIVDVEETFPNDSIPDLVLLQNPTDGAAAIKSDPLPPEPVVQRPRPAARNLDVRKPEPTGGKQRAVLFGAVFLGVFAGCFLAMMAYLSLTGSGPSTPPSSPAEPVARLATPAPEPTQPKPPEDRGVAPPDAEKPPPRDIVKRPAPPIRPAVPPQPPVDPWTALMADLKGADQRRRQQALTQLARQVPEAARRQEAVNALLAATLNPSPGQPPSTEAALTAWATRENTPALLKLLENGNDKIRAVGMSVVGSLKDPRAAEPLAALLAKEPDRSRAAAALKKIGPGCESAVWPHLNSTDPQIRRTGCEILGEIGTVQSYGPLQARANDSDFFVRTSAQRAIDAIKKR